MQVPAAVLAAMLGAAAFAGCVGDDAATDPVIDDFPLPVEPPVLACPAPCEVAVSTGPGKVFEPHLAVDPSDPDRLVAAASVMHTDPAGIAQRAMAVYVSEDGGASWTKTFASVDVPPDDHPLARCAVIGDHTVGILADGTVLVAGFAGATAASLSGFVVHSTDGGHTFEDPVWFHRATAPAPCDASDGPGGLPHGGEVDRPVLAVGGDGTVVVFYSRIFQAPGLVWRTSDDGGRSWSDATMLKAGGAVSGPALVVHDANRIDLVATDFGRGQIVFMRTIDGGDTWSETDIGPTGNQFAELGVVTDVDGEAIVVGFAQRLDGGGLEPAAGVSRDGGATFEITRLDEGAAQQFPFVSVAGGDDGDAYIAYTVDAGGGAAQRHVVAWHQGRFSEAVDVTTTTMGRGDMTPMGYGHYLGITAVPGGAYTVWGAGPPLEAGLFGARLVLSPASV